MNTKYQLSNVRTQYKQCYNIRPYYSSSHLAIIQHSFQEKLLTNLLNNFIEKILIFIFILPKLKIGNKFINSQIFPNQQFMIPKICVNSVEVEFMSIPVLCMKKSSTESAQSIKIKNPESQEDFTIDQESFDKDQLDQCHNQKSKSNKKIRLPRQYNIPRHFQQKRTFYEQLSEMSAAEIQKNYISDAFFQLKFNQYLKCLQNTLKDQEINSLTQEQLQRVFKYPNNHYLKSRRIFNYNLNHSQYQKYSNIVKDIQLRRKKCPIFSENDDQI